MATVAQEQPGQIKEKVLIDYLPPEVLQPITSKAFKTFLWSILLVTVGYVLVATLPYYFLPILWIFLGACYAGIHAVSMDCGRGSFSNLPLMNEVVGYITSLWLLLPFESVKLHLKENLVDSTYKMLASNSWTFWMSSTLSWLRLNFGFSTIFKKGNRRRVVLSLISLWMFGFVVFPILHNYVGFWGVCKFYLIPYCIYHVWMSSFITMAYRESMDKSMPTVRVSIAFPTKLPQWLELITNDINYVLSMSKQLKNAVVPNTNMRRAFDIMKELANIESIKDQQIEKAQSWLSVVSNALAKFNWVAGTYILVTPLLALYGVLTATHYWQTWVLAAITYAFAGFGITVGYHRLFSHRSFDCGPILRSFILACGTMAFQGSGLWWSRDHRAHHRYVDTPKDPYNMGYGFFWSHMGWLLVKQDRNAIGKADTTDLDNDPLLRFQDKYYTPLALLSSIILPTCIAGFGWGDWHGGFFIASILRSVLVLQNTFCVNSLAHWSGSHTFTDDHSPVDNWLVSLVTFGEGYHNFHHEFPYDFRNGVKWYAFDPSKWIIWTLSLVGATFNLKRFPMNEIVKGELQMIQKRLDRAKQKVNWGPTPDQLPVYTMQQMKNRCEEGSKLIVVDGFVHDVAEFMNDHPGGVALVKHYIGKDATSVFNGGVYAHSTAAKNLLTTIRVGRIESPAESKKSL